MTANLLWRWSNGKERKSPPRQNLRIKWRFWNSWVCWIADGRRYLVRLKRGNVNAARLWEERQRLVSWFLVFWSYFISRLLFACVCHVCEQRGHFSSHSPAGDVLWCPDLSQLVFVCLCVSFYLFICLAATCLRFGTQDLLLRCTDSLAASRGPSRQSQCVGLVALQSLGS